MYEGRYLIMHMRDIVRQVGCKHCSWSRGNKESTTAWLICKKLNKRTDEDKCAICKDKEPK